jgi:WD40 repeat protein
MLLYRKMVIAAVLFGIASGLNPVSAIGPDDTPIQSLPSTALQPANQKPKCDLQGDPLPPDAIARMGSLRWRYDSFYYELIFPSPTGNAVAIYLGPKLGVISLKDGQLLCEISSEKGNSIRSRFTPDGSRLMVPCARGVVQFFDATTGKLSGETKPVVEKDIWKEVGGVKRVLTSHKFTEDGGWLFTNHPEADGPSLILSEIDPKPGAIPRQLKLELPDGFGKSVTVDHFTCTSGTGIGVGFDLGKGEYGVFRWDLSNGKLTSATRIKAHGYGVLSSEGKRFVTLHDCLRVWDTESGNEVAKLEEPIWRRYAPRFSADGKRVVAIVTDPADTTKTLFVVLEVDTGKVIGLLSLPNEFTFPFLLPDNRTLVATDELMVAAWDITTGRRVNPTVGHESTICHLDFSNDGVTLYTASHKSSEMIIAWDAGAGKKLRELAAPGSRFVLAPSGVVTSAISDGTLICADSKTGKELRRIEPKPLVEAIESRIWSVDLSPCSFPRTGRPAAFGILSTPNSGTLVAFWDAVSGELLDKRKLNRPRGGPVAISPDGRLLAWELKEMEPGIITPDKANLQSVVFEDALTGERVLRLNQPDYLESHTTFMPDGHSFISWTSTIPARLEDYTPSGKVTIRLWEVWSGKQRQSIALPVVSKYGLYEPEAMAISADGRWLAGARPDKTIFVWEIATGKEVAKRSGYRTRVGALAFRPDGKALASGHADGTVVVWDLSGLTPTKAPEIDRESAWKDLASSDAAKAYQAILSLSADSGSVVLFRERLKPTPPAPAGEVNRLVDELDNQDFQIREKATTALAKLADAAYTELRAALRKELSPEQRSRIDGILARSNRLSESDPDRLRALRCIEVLERIASADARTVLTELARGTPGARLTKEAANALLHLPRP